MHRFLRPALAALIFLTGSVNVRCQAAPAEPLPIHRLRLPEVVETLYLWAKVYPELLHVEKRGETTSGLPLLLARVTDPAYPDADKQVLLVASFHSGAERSGATSAMAFLQWLLSEDPLARETRARQVVLIMPVLNPYGFERESNQNEQKLDPYSSSRGTRWDIDTLTLRNPEELPEVAAFMGVVDEYRPEVHVDLHGVAVGGWNGRETPETAGPAGSNVALRPWDSRLSDRIARAANEAGYGIYRMEMDEERILWAEPMKAHSQALWWGRYFFYTGHYPYLKYHTLPITLEITWEESAMARLKEIVRIGNEHAPTEKRPGYPVNVIASNGYTQLVAWGKTAAEIRPSRVELWARQAHIPLASMAPKADGRIFFASILTARGLEPFQKALTETTADPEVPRGLTKDETLRFVESAPGIENRDALTAFLRSGPETRLVFDWTGISPKPPLDTPISNGLAYRIRIPHPKVTLHEVRLNGIALAQDQPLGYELWNADGFTHLRVNIPPKEASKLDVALIQCHFSPVIPRRQGWTPPSEVLEILRKRETR